MARNRDVPKFLYVLCRKSSLLATSTLSPSLVNVTYSNRSCSRFCKPVMVVRDSVAKQLNISQGTRAAISLVPNAASLREHNIHEATASKVGYLLVWPHSDGLVLWKLKQPAFSVHGGRFAFLDHFSFLPHFRGGFECSYVRETSGDWTAFDLSVFVEVGSIIR